MSDVHDVYTKAADKGELLFLLTHLRKIRKRFGVLPEQLMSRLRMEVEVYEIETEEVCLYYEALKSDEGLLAYRKKNFGGKQPPIVRASTYKTLITTQEIIPHTRFWSIRRNDERRPVFMRGSRAVRMTLYDSQSAYYRAICNRYLRFIRYTCFDKRTHVDNLSHLNTRASKKWNCHQLRLGNNDPDFDVSWSRDECTVWIAGVHYRNLRLRFPGHQMRQEEVLPPPQPLLGTVEDHRFIQTMTLPGKTRDRGLIVIAALKELGIEI